MGQADRLLSPKSLQLNETIVATANTGGQATFTFTTPPAGTWKTGTLNCAGAGPGASFAASVGATPWGSWQGFTVFGPVQAQDNQILTVAASGLVPGNVYEMTWIGSVDESTIIQPISPDSNSNSIASINIYGTVLTLINEPGNVGLNLPFSSGVPQMIPTTLNLAGFALWLGASTDVEITLTAGSLEWQETIANPNPFLPIIIPVPVTGGQSWALTLTNVGTGSNGITGLVLQGLGQLPPMVPVLGQPVGVTTRGGILTAEVVVAANTTSQILPAPPTGMCYRLHTFSAIGVLYLEDGSSTHLFAALPGIGSVVMDGQIALGSVTCQNPAAGAQAGWVTYDLIPLQEII